MKSDATKQKNTTALRRRTEKQIKKPGEAAPKMSREDALELAHELEVHQVELAIQNEELRRSQTELEESRKKYFDLYDLAPIGYTTLDRSGRIREINLAGADLLGKERRYLKGRLFAGFVAKPARVDFQMFLRRLFKTGSREKCEIMLEDANKFPMKAMLLGVAFENRGESSRLCQIAIMDISAHSQLIKELEASRQDLHVLAARLQAVREEERTRLARMIHDELSGSLTALKMDLSLLPDRAAKDQALFGEKLRSMSALIDSSLNRVQSMVTELRPLILDQFGLTAAIEWQVGEFEGRLGIACEKRLPAKEISLDPERSTAIFRILQEALTNVARHAQATKVVVDLKSETGSVILMVRDNGKGIDENVIDAPNSIGLLGMRERALFFGGATELTSLPEGGTLVRVRIPRVEHVYK